MNKIFKVIWNHAAQRFDVVSELTKSNGKSSSTTDNRIEPSKALLAISVAGAALLGSPQAMAATTVEAAVAGGATVTSTGKSLYAATPIGTNPAFGDSVLIGKNANLTTTAGGSVVLGAEASGGSISAVIGSKAVSLGQQDVVIGPGAQQLNPSTESYSTVIGGRAINTATGEVATAIGYKAQTSASYATAIGGNSTASNSGATAIGYNATASGGTSLAMGYKANATASLSAAIGVNSKATGYNAFAATAESSALKEYAIAMGAKSVADANASIAIGQDSKVLDSAEAGIAIGGKTTASGTRAIAIGRSSWSTGNRSTAIGQLATAGGDFSIALGPLVETKATATHSGAIGFGNTVSGAGTFVYGSNITATAANNVILGQNSSESSTLTAAGAPRQVDNATVGNLYYGGFQGTATGIVSVGATGTERQIINVAPGNISATSTDAINGSQLYATNEVLGHFYKSTVDALGGKVSPDTPNTANFTLSYNLTGTNPSTSTPDQVQYTSIGDALTALSQAVNQPLTFTANTNADTGANGTQQELGSSIAIIGSKTNKALTENADAAVDSTYSAKNIQTVVTDNQVQIQMAEKPEFKEITVKADDADTNPVVITSGDGTNGGTITNLNTTLPVDTTKGTFDPKTATTTNAATLGDVLNAGWNLQENGTAKDFVKPYDTVNFVNGKGTTVTVTPSADGTSNDVKVDVNLADPNLTTTVGDTTRTDGSTGTDGKIDTPAATDGDKLVNATTVVNAINASGWNVYQDDTTDANKKDTVNPGNNVVFKAGTNTTVNVESDGTTTNVTYDIDLSKINDALAKTDLNVSTAPTTTNNQTPTGKVETPTAENATKLVNAGDIVDAINSSGFTLKSSATAEGTKDPASTGDELINPGDVIEMVAGKNMTVKQDANGKITYSTKDSVEFTNVNVTSKLPVTSINVGEKAAKAPTDLLNLTTAVADSPNAVVTAKDLANYGWVVATPDNGYDAAVKSANTVNFIGDNHISVTGANNATTGTYDVKIELANAGAIDFVEDTTGAAPVNTGAVKAGDVDGNNPTGFVSAKTVADAINGSGWRTNSTTATGPVTETLVNPGEQVNFEAGKNMVVTQKVEKDANGADVISYTYATADDITFNSTTVGGNKITYTDADGNPITKNDAGDFVDAQGNVVDPADVITKVENPITIGTVDGKNVISNLNTTLPDVVTTNITNPADGSVTTQFTNSTARPNVPTTSLNNAATLGDVLNAGWNLQGNGSAVDFVKPYDTVNFVNGTGTTAVLGSDGNVSTVTYNVNVDNKTTVITYVDAAGNTVTKVGDKFYNPADLDENGAPKADAKPVENVVSRISAIGPKVNGETVSGPINIVNGDTTTVTNTPDGVKVEVNTGTSDVTDEGKATVTYTDKNGNPVTATTNPDGSVTYTDKDGKPVAAGDVVSSGDKVATVGDIINTINNVYHSVNSTTVAGTNGESTYVKNPDSQINAGDTVNYNAGQNIKISGQGNVIEIATTENVTFSNAVVNQTLSLGDVTKPGAPVVNMTAVHASTPVGVENGDITPAINMSNATFTGLAPNLPTTTSFANETTPVTQAQNAPKVTDAQMTNAATLGDVLNAGWNLQENGKAKDFVKPYDTVNFVNGTGTTANITTDGNVSNVTYNVNVDNQTTEITYTNKAGDTIYKLADGTYNTSADGKGTTVAAGDISGSQVSAKTSPLTNNVDGTVNKPANEKSLATAGDVAKAINNSGFTLTTSASAGEVSGTSKELVKPGKTVTIDAGKNISVTQNAGTITVATKKDVEFDSVKAGPVTIDSKGINAGGTRVTNVAPGEAGTDAVNVNQLKQVAGDIHNKINRNNKDLRAGIAGANAAAGLPQVYIPGKSMVAASAGTFKGQSAVAVGYSRASDNGKLILKLQGNANTRGDVGGSVGVGYQW